MGAHSRSTKGERNRPSKWDVTTLIVLLLVLVALVVPVQMAHDFLGAHGNWSHLYWALVVPFFVGVICLVLDVMNKIRSRVSKTAANG